MDDEVAVAVQEGGVREDVRLDGAGVSREEAIDEEAAPPPREDSRSDGAPEVLVCTSFVRTGFACRADFARLSRVAPPSPREAAALRAKAAAAAVSRRFCSRWARSSSGVCGS